MYGWPVWMLIMDKHLPIPLLRFFDSDLGVLNPHLHCVVRLPALHQVQLVRCRHGYQREA